jgi:hypothetical protein
LRKVVVKFTKAGCGLAVENDVETCTAGMTRTRVTAKQNGWNGIGEPNDVMDRYDD